MNDKEALKIFEACVDEMYKNSIPSITWDDIKKKYGDTNKTFYNKHFILNEKYDEIRNKYCKQLNTFFIRKLDWFLLDYAPSVKDTKVSYEQE